MSFHFGDETGYKEYMNISTILLAEKSEWILYLWLPVSGSNWVGDQSVLLGAAVAMEH